MKKEITHNQFEVCNLSKKQIDTEVDDYAIIIDCRGAHIGRIAFYKTNLLRDLIQGNGELIRNDLLEKHRNLAKQMIKLGLAP